MTLVVPPEGPRPGRIEPLSDGPVSWAAAYPSVVQGPRSSE